MTQAARLTRVVETIEAIDCFDLVARLTLVVLLLRSSAVWYVQIPMVPLCAAGIVFSGLYRRWEYWSLITAILTVAYVRNWFAIDNHDFLLGYWCFALALNVSRADMKEALAANARLLLGLVFGFAVIWRVLAPDFLNGEFFNFLFLTNTRFEWIAGVVGGLSAADFATNVAAISSVVSDPSTSASLIATPAVAVLAVIATWWAFSFEVFLGVSFLLPVGEKVTRIRDVVLLVFLFTTYSVASVVTFGWLLAILGITQAENGRPRLRIAYLIAFVVAWLAVLPWSNLVGVFS